jgi:hypothetical protein
MSVKISIPAAGHIVGASFNATIIVGEKDTTVDSCVVGNPPKAATAIRRQMPGSSSFVAEFSDVPTSMSPVPLTAKGNAGGIDSINIKVE